MSNLADDKPLSTKQSKGLGEKVKELWNQYGYVAVGTYFGIYVTTLGTMYFCLDTDIFNAHAIGPVFP